MRCDARWKLDVCGYSLRRRIRRSAGVDADDRVPFQVVVPAWKRHTNIDDVLPEASNWLQALQASIISHIGRHKPRLHARWYAEYELSVEVCLYDASACGTGLLRPLRTSIFQQPPPPSTGGTQVGMSTRLMKPAIGTSCSRTSCRSPRATMHM
jgi:hypothetical protein